MKNSRVRSLGIALGLSAAVLTATGCGSDGSTTTPADSKSSAAPGLSVGVIPPDFTYDGPQGGTAMVGTITNVNGCFGIAGESEPSAILVWPKQTTVSAEGGETVVKISGKSFRVGDRISFGSNGLIDLATVDVPQSCKEGTQGLLTSGVEKI